MNIKKLSVGIPYLEYRLPKKKITISELSSKKLLVSKPDLLIKFGFGSCYSVENEEEFYGMIIKCAKKLLGNIANPQDSIDTVFIYSGLSNAKTNKKSLLPQFVYPAARLQYELGLSKVHTLGITQQGCSGLLTTIYEGSRLLSTSNKRYILVISADMLPSSSKREIMYNIMSDAVGGVILDKESNKNILLHFYQEMQPYYWNTPIYEQELLAAYFPMVKRTIEQCLLDAKLTISDISWFVPHNVSKRSWKITSSLLGIPEKKIWMNNIQKVGHTISSDHIINLSDMENKKLLKKGQLLFLFTFGFGASWTCMIIKH